MSTDEPAPKTPASRRSASPKIDRLAFLLRISTAAISGLFWRRIGGTCPADCRRPCLQPPPRGPPRAPPLVDLASASPPRELDAATTVASEIWSELGREERRGKGKCCGMAEGGAGEGKRRPDRRVLSSRRALHRVRRISRDRTVREEIYASEKSVGWKEAFSIVQWF